jgi:MYXO-CTERM domain-containing protein
LENAMNRALHLALVVAVTTIPSLAHAFPSYESSIPNGFTNGCLNCHHSSFGGDARNSFGLAVEATGSPQWSSLCGADSDGDGQTNGQELGDPNCIWTRNKTPARQHDIGLPGDANSTATDPTGVDPVAGEGEGEGEGETPTGEGEGEATGGEGEGETTTPAGGCSSQTSSTGPAASGVAALVMLGALALRRRR